MAASRDNGLLGRPKPSHDDLRSPEYLMAFGKVTPCRKGYPHDWSRCPFAHPTEAARRRDPRLHPHTGIVCPRLKQEGRCELGDSCPFAHSVFEYWLHPTRYRTQICKEGAACRRWLCFFAHNAEELRIPECGPMPPSADLLIQAAALAMAGPSSVRHQPQQALDGDFGDNARLWTPAWQPPSTAAAQHAQHQAEAGHHTEAPPDLLASLLVRMMERGQVGAEQAAGLLQQLLAPGQLGGLQAETASGRSRQAWQGEERCCSDPFACIGLQADPPRAAAGSAAASRGLGGWGAPQAPAPHRTAPPAQPWTAQPWTAQRPQLLGLSAAQLAAAQVQMQGTAAGRLLTIGNNGGLEAMRESYAESALALAMCGSPPSSSTATGRSSLDSQPGGSTSTSPGGKGSLDYGTTPYHPPPQHSLQPATGTAAAGGRWGGGGGGMLGLCPARELSWPQLQQL